MLARQATREKEREYRHQCLGSSQFSSFPSIPCWQTSKLTSEKGKGEKKKVVNT